MAERSGRGKIMFNVAQTEMDIEAIEKAAARAEKEAEFQAARQTGTSRGRRSGRAAGPPQIEDWGEIQCVIFDSETKAWVTRTSKPALTAMYNEICGFIGQEANVQLLKDYVNVQEPVLCFIRSTDGFAPSMPHVQMGFEEMETRSIAAATNISPELGESVTAVFARRHAECMSDVAIMASAVMPVYAHDPMFKLPAGTSQKLLEGMLQYLSDEDGPRDKISPAYSAGKLLYLDFSATPTPQGLFETKAADLADSLKGGPVRYWETVAVYAPAEAQPAIKFFIKLVTAHAGQGGAERQNKQVKFFRDALRNRQEHKVTTAMMEIQTTLRMEQAVLTGRQRMPYLKAVRLELVRVRCQVEAAAAEAAAAEEAAAASQLEEQEGGEDGSVDEGPDPDEEDLGEQVALDLFRELDGEPEGDEDAEIGDDVEDAEADVEASQG